MNTQSSYKPPEFEGKAFTCPVCSAYAHVRWSQLLSGSQYTSVYLSRCTHCDALLTWLAQGEGCGIILWPTTSTAPIGHPDLPQECREDYDEARNIIDRSTRGAGAIMRLCLEKLCANLTGNPKQSINDNIKALVADGLPIRIQQSLDYLRVIGNHAVHPGQIDLRDSPEMVYAMFALVNIIVEDRITQPRLIESLYARIPEGARDAIERRDGTSQLASPTPTQPDS